MCIHVAAHDIEITQRTSEAEDSNPTWDNNREVSFRDNLVKEPEEVVVDHNSYSTSVWAAMYPEGYVADRNGKGSHFAFLAMCLLETIEIMGSAQCHRFPRLPGMWDALCSKHCLRVP